MFMSEYRSPCIEYDIWDHALAWDSVAETFRYEIIYKLIFLFKSKENITNLRFPPLFGQDKKA